MLSSGLPRLGTDLAVRRFPGVWKLLSFYMCVCSVGKSHLTLCNPLDYSPPGSSIHGIFQARVLEWGAIAFAALDEAQAGIKTAGRNNNNLRYAEDTSLMSEREELKNFLMKVKEES